MEQAYQKTHIRSLTGMRFIAALLVFISHMVQFWPIFDLQGLPLGGAGVSYFFLLSGFILVYVYGAPQDSRSGFDFKKFYLRRFARIWPLHFVTLILSLVFVHGFQSFSGQPNSMLRLVAHLCLLQSWISDRSWILCLNGVSWSLSVEAFFYATFPFLLIGGAKNFIAKYLLILAATVAAVVAINQIFSHGNIPGYFPPTIAESLSVVELVRSFPPLRFLEFASGMGCGFCLLNRKPTRTKPAIWWRDSVLETIAIGTTVFFFWVSNRVGFYPTDYSNHAFAYLLWFRVHGAIPVFALIILTFASTRGWFTSILASHPLVYLGEISFSFYMVHITVMQLIFRFQSLQLGVWPLITSCLFSAAVSLMASSILYHLIEIPFRRIIVTLFEDRQKTEFWVTLKKSLGDFFSIPRFPMLMLAVVICGFLLYNSQQPVTDQQLISRIENQTAPVLRNVQFEQDAVLLGATTRVLDTGELELRLAWQLHPGRRQIRVIRLLDKWGKLVSHAEANRKLFDSVTGSAKIVDQVRISPDDLKSVQTIDVCFFEPDRGVAKIEDSTGQANKTELIIWQRTATDSW